MRVQVEISRTDPQGRVFLGWSPVKATVRLVEGGDGSDIPVSLGNSGAAGGGRLVFSDVRSDDQAGELALTLPGDGSPVGFWVAGKFGSASVDYGDCAVAVTARGGEVLGTCEAMVRVRKDAATLTARERDRFLEALGELNQAGAGPFQAYRDMHTFESRLEAHRLSAFPPWHRAYLLDLERELQGIDPEVSLPYWRFDRPAPGLFAPEFLGMPPADPAEGDMVAFPPGHALEFWATDGVPGILRRPQSFFDINRAPPAVLQGRPHVITEEQTVDLGSTYAEFLTDGQNDATGQTPFMEMAPHGMAHTSFTGSISSVPTAAKDPLFFLLHCNVDRLWAKWQWLHKRSDPTDPAAYQGHDRDGHRLHDTMWPWNGITGAPRPATAPGGAMPGSPVVTAPGPTPTVAAMIDYQGIATGQDLGFAYDDVPFEL